MAVEASKYKDELDRTQGIIDSQASELEDAKKAMEEAKRLIDILENEILVA